MMAEIDRAKVQLKCLQEIMVNEQFTTNRETKPNDQNIEQSNLGTTEKAQRWL